MGAIPWADWIYALPHRRDEVNHLHDAALTAQETILKDGNTAATRVDQYKRMVATNLLLMMTINEAHLGHDDYLQYRQHVQALEEPANGSLPAEIVSFIAEFAAGNYVFKALFRAKDALVKAIPTSVRRGIAKVAPEVVEPEATLPDAGGRSGVSSPDNAGQAIDPESETGTIELPEGESAPPIGEETAEIGEETVGREVGTEAAAENMGKAALGEWAGIGIGLAIAVGIDVAFAALSGASEKEQLDKEIEQLRKATDKMNAATGKLSQRITDAERLIIVEQRRLSDFVVGMEKIFGSRPEIPRPAKVGMAYYSEWVAYGTSTVNHYHIFSDLKAKRANYMLRHPQATMKQFVDWYVEGAGVSIDVKKLEEYATLLDEVSKRAYPQGTSQQQLSDLSV
ncbi:hypothetical protein [Streptomyces sp. NPDC047928]|uniref:hypothetical protein n=1 Tax=unclassified Streptomyces TaxID=2593676 RepID=UPI003713B13E